MMMKRSGQQAEEMETGRCVATSPAPPVESALQFSTGRDSFDLVDAGQRVRRDARRSAVIGIKIDVAEHSDLPERSSVAGAARLRVVDDTYRCQ